MRRETVPYARINQEASLTGAHIMILDAFTGEVLEEESDSKPELLEVEELELDLQVVPIELEYKPLKQRSN